MARRRQQYAGYTFRLTPRNSFSVGGTATLPLPDGGQLFITPIYMYKSKHHCDDDNALFRYGLRQDGFGVTNVRAGWRSPKGRWEATAYAKNLFDEDYLIDAGNTGGSFEIPTYVAGEPRRVGVQVSVRW